MNDILSPKQVKARGIIRSVPRGPVSSARPKAVYDQVYDRSADTDTVEEVTTKKVVSSITTTSTPMAKAIEHLSSEEKADIIQRARLQASGAAVSQRSPQLNQLILDRMSNVVTSTVTTVVTTTKRTVPHINRVKSQIANNRHVQRVGRLGQLKQLQQLQRLNQPFVQRYGLFALAGVMVLVTGYVSIDTLITNNSLREQAQTTTTDTVAVAGASSNTNEFTPTSASQEGADETEIGPSLIDQYSVAPDMPRVLSIDKIGVKARVIPMGVNDDKSVQAPANIFDSGWYNGSAKPGEKGAVFIDAHASGATRQGLFAYLDQLEKGDTVNVEKGDGSTLTYQVVHKETVPLGEVNMTKVLQPHTGVTNGLNLMTCAGQWVQDSETYDHRTVVYTKQL